MPIWGAPRAIYFGVHAVSTEWFNRSVTAGLPLAGVPGTPDAASMAKHGAISTPASSVIDAIHLHQMEDGSSGNTTLEVYRYRKGVFTLIANCTLAQGGGDNTYKAFTPVSKDLMSLKAGDYLYLQPTEIMTGNNVTFVDVHFKPRRITG